MCLILILSPTLHSFSLLFLSISYILSCSTLVISPLLLQNDVDLIKEGTKVGASEATLLQMLKIMPFSYSLIVQQGESAWVWDEWVGEHVGVGVRMSVGVGGYDCVYSGVYCVECFVGVV